MRRVRPRLHGAILAAAVLVPVGARADDEAPLGEEALEARRAALETWTREPVALEGPVLRVLLDRHDGSFSVRDRRSGRSWYSRTRARGFAAVRLASGETRDIDRVENLRVTGERLRFRGASSAGDVPPIEFEFSTSGAAIEIAFSISPEHIAEIEHLALIDQGFWIADADGGRVSLPRGGGEWIDASGDDLIASLAGDAHRARSADGRFPAAAYAVPAMGIERAGATLLVYWLGPLSVEVRRAASADEALPGHRSLATTLRFGPGTTRGAIRLAGELLETVGHLDLARIYRELRSNDLQEASLRFKTGGPTALDAIVRAPLFRFACATAPAGLARAGAPRFTFDDVSAVADRLRSELEIDAGLVLLHDWVGPPSSAGSSFTLAAAAELGGDARLEALGHRLDEAGWLLGLALDRSQLIVDATAERPAGAKAWRFAAECADSAAGLRSLSRFGADLLVLTSPYGEGDAPELLQARQETFAAAIDAVPLLGSNLVTLGDLGAVSWCEGFLERRRMVPEDAAALPLAAAILAPYARLAPPIGDELGPGDEAALLGGLLYGQAPALAIPGPRYWEAGQSETTSTSSALSQEGGWTAGRQLSARDRFIKNAYELTGRLAEIQSREILVAHRSLVPDGSVRASQFGYDLRVVVNFGPEPWEDEETGAILPQHGFVIRHPFFFAFHALRAEGVDYDAPAFFTVQSLEGKLYLRAEKTRIYHGFGAPRIRLGGKDFEVEREATVKIW